ncbi:MAG: hypothetical protein MPJ22_03045, partial [Pirellulales bacterium]|nr:hypothetical protein [Pirellulales bacterium]
SHARAIATASRLKPLWEEWVKRAKARFMGGGILADFGGKRGFFVVVRACWRAWLSRMHCRRVFCVSCAY